MHTLHVYKFANWPRAQMNEMLWHSDSYPHRAAREQEERGKKERTNKTEISRMSHSLLLQHRQQQRQLKLCTRHVTLRETCFFFHGQCSRKLTVTKLHWLYLIFAIYLRNSQFCFALHLFRCCFFLHCIRVYVCISMCVCVCVHYFYVHPLHIAVRSIFYSIPFAPSRRCCCCCYDDVPLKCRAWKLLNVNELETRKSTNWLIELEWFGWRFSLSLILFHAVVSLRYFFHFLFSFNVIFFLLSHFPFCSLIINIMSKLWA